MNEQREREVRELLRREAMEQATRDAASAVTRRGLSGATVKATKQWILGIPDDPRNYFATA